MKSREAYWDRLFKGYEQSGLSQEDFCIEQGIPITKFKYQWRKKTGTGIRKDGAQNQSDSPFHFEPILLGKKDSAPQEPEMNQLIIIQLPNQIAVN